MLKILFILPETKYLDPNKIELPEPETYTIIKPYEISSQIESFDIFELYQLKKEYQN